MPGPQRLTIDLDGAWCYRAIHGFDVGSDAAQAAPDDDVLLQGLPRFLELCARLSAKATLFVVGRDLDNDRYADLVNAAVDAGHDVASHSFSHAYDLSRRSYDAARRDVDASVRAIVDVTGRAPAGFRAPGYNVSAALLDAVKDAGLSWSSSLLPSPAYFAARALVIARTALSGRRSASLLGDVRAFSSRRRRHKNGLAEFPLSAPWGIPLTGTTLALLGDDAAAALVDAAADDADVSIEFHAADFVDGRLLPEGQPDRRVRLSDKLVRMEAAARRVVQVAPRSR